MENEHSMQDHQGNPVALPEDARQQVVSGLPSSRQWVSNCLTS